MRKYTYVVIITSTDWYEIISTIKEVKAVNQDDAVNQVMQEANIKQLYKHNNLYVFGPFSKPRKENDK